MRTELLLIDKEFKDIELFVEQFAKDGEQVILKTGEYGMLLFHRLANQSEKKLVLVNVDDKDRFYQYINYKVWSDTLNISYIVELLHDPTLDDKSIHWKVDETTGFPLSSSTLYYTKDE